MGTGGLVLSMLVNNLMLYIIQMYIHTADSFSFFVRLKSHLKLIKTAWNDNMRDYHGLKITQVQVFLVCSKKRSLMTLPWSTGISLYAYITARDDIRSVRMEDRTHVLTLLMVRNDFSGEAVDTGMVRRIVSMVANSERDLNPKP